MTTFDTPETYNLAMRQARGTYQRDLLDGYQTWSGADLRGRAASYSVHYRNSRDNLLRRCKAAGLTVTSVTGPHGRRDVHIVGV